MPITRKKIIYPRPFLIPIKLFFDVNNTLILFLYESEKSIYETWFWNENFEICQILNSENYNALDS